MGQLLNEPDSVGHERPPVSDRCPAGRRLQGLEQLVLDADRLLEVGVIRCSRVAGVVGGRRFGPAVGGRPTRTVRTGRGRPVQVVREAVQQGRFAGVGVARKRHQVEPLLASPPAVLGGGVGGLLQLAVEVVDPALEVLDRLRLLVAELLHVALALDVLADPFAQAGEFVAQAGVLDLELCPPAGRALGEDREHQPVAVHDLDAVGEAIPEFVGL